MDNIKKVSLFPRGIIRIPSSKSVSHRAVICAALAKEQSELENLAVSDDLEATKRCMRAIRRGLFDNETEDMTLDCGESGSTLRFLIPLAALMPGKTRFMGHGRLMERPLGPYMDQLALHGVTLDMQNGVLTVSGPLKPGVFRIPGDISSQFVTGLLLALPMLGTNSEILITSPLESASYVDLTIDVLERFGVSVENVGYQSFIVKGGQPYRACSMKVEADYSQAAFFLVSGALGCECECLGLASDSKQGDRKIVDILRKSGAEVCRTEGGGLSAKPGRLTSQTIDVSDIPDLVPPLAAFLCFCKGTSRIINAGRLRHKESDRLAAVTEELNRLGAKITMTEDSLEITGVRALRGGVMSARGDHRIAMMGAAAAIKSESPVFIEGADCISKSYPNFWSDFERTCLEVNV